MPDTRYGGDISLFSVRRVLRCVGLFLFKLFAVDEIINRHVKIVGHAFQQLNVRIALAVLVIRKGFAADV